MWWKIEILCFPTFGVWETFLQFTVLLNHNQCIAFSCVAEETTIFIVVVYAFTFYTQRRDLWSSLTDVITNNQGPWLLVGDFNATLRAHEKIGGRLPLSVACYDFLNWSTVNSRILLDTAGVKYTWSTNKVGKAFFSQRLDKAFCNDHWIDSWTFTSRNTLARCQSDNSDQLEFNICIDSIIL